MALRTPRPVQLLDIRSDRDEASLRQLVLQGLCTASRESRKLPTLILYDERGLKLFEQITYLEEYYLTNTEIEILETHADKIASRLSQGTRLVELGSGNLRKVKILLDAVERAQTRVDYFALDVSKAELRRTFSKIDVQQFRFVEFHGLNGTYDDGLSWLAKTMSPQNPTCVLTLGSSMGNFNREQAASFLRGFAKILGPADSFLVGLDGCQDPERVFYAYNDRKGLTHEFYRNGLDHANKILGVEVFKQAEWEVVGRFDELEGKHEAHYRARNDIEVMETMFKQGDLLKLEDAFKYSAKERNELWMNAGLIHQSAFANSRGDYAIHLLTPVALAYPTQPQEYAARPAPSIEDWYGLWAAWDTVTRGMIPQEDLLDKPIKLRNSLIFYLGHIPTFADIHMTRATSGLPTDPAYYMSIFERGIDPDVDDPEKCHDHSEVPDTWPALDEILDYQVRVRQRIRTLLETANSDRKVGRALWLAFEHEAMHLETFLYMLLQSEKILPPPGTTVPDFESMAREAKAKRVPNEWHVVPQRQITIGLDDPEDDLGPDRYFGWDNERPARTVDVPAFEAQSRPITNGEYARFLELSGSGRLPASWAVKDSTRSTANGANGYTNGLNGHGGDGGENPSHEFMQGKFVRTVYGSVPLEHALDWPVMASYDELAAFASWSNGRIPKFEEARSIYNYVSTKEEVAAKKPTGLISAVNGHLSNDGVEETPPYGGQVNGFPSGKPGPDPDETFIDLDGDNVAFKSWHPTCVTHKGGKLCGQSDMGGAWEWTSSPLAEFEGFKPMDLYPGYTADFFDEKHNIILGGSWATHPRIAGRKSFVNWYQRNYPHTWATARLVRDT